MVVALDHFLKLCGEEAPAWNRGFAAQAEQAERILNLVKSQPQAFERSCFPAHVTGSAFIVDEIIQETLLVHHKKLNKWMQPGGHSDGDSESHRVAMREAQEETGLACLSFLPLPGVSGEAGVPIPFDVDIHVIPPHKGEPEHFHFDLRYLLVASSGSQPVVSDESHDVRWFSFMRVSEYTQEESVLRMVEKARRIRQALMSLA